MNQNIGLIPRFRPHQQGRGLTSDSDPFLPRASESVGRGRMAVTVAVKIESLPTPRHDLGHTIRSVSVMSSEKQG